MDTDKIVSAYLGSWSLLEEAGKKKLKIGLGKILMRL